MGTPVLPRRRVLQGGTALAGLALLASFGLTIPHTVLTQATRVIE
jgi:hypothetical protein